MKSHAFRTILLALSVILIATLSACGNGNKADKSKAAAIVNGDIITKDEFSREMDLFKQQLSTQQQNLSDEELKGFETELLENLIQRKLLDQEIVKAKIRIDKDVVENELQNIKTQFPTTEEYTAALAEQGFTEESLTDQISKTKSREKFFDEKFRKTITVSDDDAMTYYNGNPELFTQPEQVRASHIIILVPPGASEDEKKQALAKIKTIETKIKNGGDFAVLAKEYSMDGSKDQGGDLDFFGPGDMVPEFEKAAFALTIGETSGIVETQFGYHLIKLTDRRQADSVDFESVKSDLKDYLSQEKVVAAVNEYLAELRKKSKVTIMIQ
ncbi:MAG: peptidylprolyl isomerase [Spirochaetales bacterium]|nr:MAG: peptidylprolyl isomerase [Spirochaetales bacterium]